MRQTQVQGSIIPWGLDKTQSGSSPMGGNPRVPPLALLQGARPQHGILPVAPRSHMRSTKRSWPFGDAASKLAALQNVNPWVHFPLASHDAASAQRRALFAQTKSLLSGGDIALAGKASSRFFVDARVAKTKVAPTGMSATSAGTGAMLATVAARSPEILTKDVGINKTLPGTSPTHAPSCAMSAESRVMPGANHAVSTGPGFVLAGINKTNAGTGAKEGMNCQLPRLLSGCLKTPQKLNPGNRTNLWNGLSNLYLQQAVGEGTKQKARSGP